MSKPSLILIGAGGHARSCIDVIEDLDIFTIAGLVDSVEDPRREFFGYRVVGLDVNLPDLAKVYQYALITVGQIKSSCIRKRLYAEALALGFKFPAIISRHALVSPHSKVGSGTIIMHGAIIKAGVNIGNNCIINTGAIIEHDTVIENHCHIATGAILNGGVKIASGGFIGSGSVVKQGVSLGINCVVGMGIAVRHDHEENSLILRSSR